MVGGQIPEEVFTEIVKNKYSRVGYVNCFNCLEGRSSFVTKPPIKTFLDELAGFFGGDRAEHTFGNRSAQFAVFNMIAKETKRKGLVLVDSLCHYTSTVNIENVGLKLEEVPHSGYPNYEITAENYRKTLDELEKNKKKPALVLLTHVDPYYGNLVNPKEISDVVKEYDIPFMLNAAYTGGIIPINMKKWGVDFLCLSAHKSMSSMAPLGYLVTNYEYADKVFQTSLQTPGWTKRAFGKKIPNLFGCSIGGLPLISSMLSFDSVKKRVTEWKDKLKEIQWFINKFEDIGEGTMLLGQNPHKHHLMHFDTPLFYELSKKHKRKGFFLAKALEKKGFIGIHKGMTKHIKFSVYDLNKKEKKELLDAFEGIVKA